MRRFKYFSIILIFCTMIFICCKAISINLVSHASERDSSKLSDELLALNNVDDSDTTSDVLSAENDEYDEDDEENYASEEETSSEEISSEEEQLSDEDTSSTEEESADTNNDSLSSNNTATPEADVQNSKVSTITQSNSTNTTEKNTSSAQSKQTTSSSTKQSTNNSTSNNKTNVTSKNETSSQVSSNSSSQTNSTQSNSSKPVSTPVPTPIPTVAPTLAPIVIPKIYSPSTPGSVTYVATNSTATIDASNTSKGYIGVKYNGSNWKVKVQISCNGTTYNYDLPSDGNYVIYPLQFGNGTYKISVFENVSGTSYMEILSQDISVNITNSSLVYLYPNQYVWFTQNSALVQKSAEICRGLTRDIDKVSAIFKYVTSTISYDYNKATTVKSGYLPVVDSILASKKGICFDYAAVFAGMCRAQGIPCKLVTGYVSDGQYHAWNEVYVKNTGSVTSTLSIDRTGYNRLDPTFYSSMSESSAATYIKNSSNYQTYKYY